MCAWIWMQYGCTGLHKQTDAFRGKARKLYTGSMQEDNVTCPLWRAELDLVARKNQHSVVLKHNRLIKKKRKKNRETQDSDQHQHQHPRFDAFLSFVGFCISSNASLVSQIHTSCTSSPTRQLPRTTPFCSRILLACSQQWCQSSSFLFGKMAGAEQMSWNLSLAVVDC